MSPQQPVVILVPVPVPAGSGGIGYEKRAKPPPYQHQQRPRWPLRHDLPAPSQVRDMLADARRLIAEQRARLQAHQA